MCLAYSFIYYQTPAGQVQIENDNAEFVARQAVIDCLKYPHDAEFPGVASVTTEADLRVVCGLVKAKNGFGLALTHEYRVLVEGSRALAVRIDDEFVYVAE